MAIIYFTTFGINKNAIAENVEWYNKIRIDLVSVKNRETKHDSFLSVFSK